jgi:hypothetical protein
LAVEFLPIDAAIQAIYFALNNWIIFHDDEYAQTPWVEYAK